ncbi:PREDICTED: neutrophil defensin 6-like [Mandrillus leucophaeus]|uniref:Mammalian defensins domain-containing protein n=1 Tax=Mandrillus leucophaeus TaxID=9568 RepID=A0A2K5Y414_MANLE|nr:PREDICTED: neutrophil defensin 6-like [Mandrillus leucophaeus]
MRTLAILAAILLFALQAQAESLQERADEAATQEQPGEDDQDLAVSFEENGLSTLRASGSQARITCYCRNGKCFLRESFAGWCNIGGHILRLCCR